jgi:hypothetical protein
MHPDAQKSYWDLLAPKFQHQQPPLRPCAEDVRIFERVIREQYSRHQRGQTSALMFGVTPEIASLDWPAGTRLLAVEKSQPMINLVWPGNIPGRRDVIHENWFDLSLADCSQEIVIGDGVLTALAWPEQQHVFARMVARWLKTDGRLILRVFVRRLEGETQEEILADLQARRIPTFDILKWRLAMMLQPSVTDGVALDSVYRAWEDLERNHPQLLALTGWPAATMDTIRLYSGRTQRYAFPTMEELTAAFSPFLVPEEIIIPRYEFGQCCPIVICRPAKLIN